MSSNLLSHAANYLRISVRFAFRFQSAGVRRGSLSGSIFYPVEGRKVFKILNVKADWLLDTTS